MHVTIGFCANSLKIKRLNNADLSWFNQLCNNSHGGFFMIIIWTRLGFLVPVIGLLGLGFFQLAVDAMFGAGTYSKSGMIINLSVVFAGVLIFMVGKLLNNPDKLYIRCEHSRELLEVNGKHEFFFIPFKWCGVLISIIAIMILIDNII